MYYKFDQKVDKYKELYSENILYIDNLKILLYLHRLRDKHAMLWEVIISLDAILNTDYILDHVEDII